MLKGSAGAGAASRFCGCGICACGILPPPPPPPQPASAPNKPSVTMQERFIWALPGDVVPPLPVGWNGTLVNGHQQLGKPQSTSGAPPPRDPAPSTAALWEHDRTGLGRELADYGQPALFEGVKPQSGERVMPLPDTRGTPSRWQESRRQVPSGQRASRRGQGLSYRDTNHT